MNKILPNSKKGFTLIELLVVIAIIAILAVIGITVFSGQQATARDARRKADVQSIAQAMEANKTPNTSTYNVLAGSYFAGGTIPTDTSTAQYSVCYTTTAGTVVNGAGYNPPTTWAAASANPTAVVTNCAGGAWATVSAAAPAALSTGWTICARLESTGTFYCQSNGQ